MIGLADDALAAHGEEELAAKTLLAARQTKIEQALYRRYLARCGTLPTLFLCDVISSCVEKV